MCVQINGATLQFIIGAAITWGTILASDSRNRFDGYLRIATVLLAPPTPTCEARFQYLKKTFGVKDITGICTKDGDLQCYCHRDGGIFKCPELFFGAQTGKNISTSNRIKFNPTQRYDCVLYNLPDCYYNPRAECDALNTVLNETSRVIVTDNLKYNLIFPYDERFRSFELNEEMDCQLKTLTLQSACPIGDNGTIYTTSGNVAPMNAGKEVVYMCDCRDYSPFDVSSYLSPSARQHLSFPISDGNSTKREEEADYRFLEVNWPTLVTVAVLLLLILIGASTFYVWRKGKVQTLEEANILQSPDQWNQDRDEDSAVEDVETVEIIATTRRVPAQVYSKSAKYLIPGPILGEKGAFSTVYVARHTLLNQEMAIKRVSVTKTYLHFKSLKQLRYEAKHQNATSPFVVRIYDCWFEGPEGRIDAIPSYEVDSLSTANSTSIPYYMFIQMELCDYSLRKWLNEDSPLSIKELHELFYHTLSGLQVLYSKDIIHGDIKPDNILCKIDPTTNLKVWKIGDFGMSKEFKESLGGEEDGLLSEDVYDLGLAFLETVYHFVGVKKNEKERVELYKAASDGNFLEIRNYIETLETGVENHGTSVDQLIEELVVEMLTIEPEYRISAAGGIHVLDRLMARCGD